MDVQVEWWHSLLTEFIKFILSSAYLDFKTKQILLIQSAKSVAAQLVLFWE